jgi:ribosomal protein S18 acetylase RimI-like enzyme
MLPYHRRRDVVRVREAESADTPGIGETHVRSWQGAYRGLIADDYLDSLLVEDRCSSWTKILAELGSRSGVLVLVDGGEFVGFCSWRPSPDEDADLSVGEVSSIYLMPDRWREGGGSALLARAETGMGRDGFASAALWVLDGNDRAFQFYASHGWTSDGVRRQEDRGSVVLDEVRLRKVLAA